MPRWLFRHLALRAQDAAPFLVLGHGHSAFDADAHALSWLGLPREQLAENRHVASGWGRTGGDRAPGPTDRHSDHETEKPLSGFAGIRVRPSAGTAGSAVSQAFATDSRLRRSTIAAREGPRPGARLGVPATAQGRDPGVHGRDPRGRRRVRNR